MWSAKAPLCSAIKLSNIISLKENAQTNSYQVLEILPRLKEMSTLKSDNSVLEGKVKEKVPRMQEISTKARPDCTINVSSSSFLRA